MFHTLLIIMTDLVFIIAKDIGILFGCHSSVIDRIVQTFGVIVPPVQRTEIFYCINLVFGYLSFTQNGLREDVVYLPSKETVPVPIMVFDNPSTTGILSHLGLIILIIFTAFLPNGIYELLVYLHIT